MIRTEEEKQPNLSVITEQGDLGLGTRELTDAEQKQVDDAQRFGLNERAHQNLGNLNSRYSRK